MHASVAPSVSPPALLEAIGLCKFYGAREVLHAVSLHIAPREIVTIVGPNGAGKTTLLKTLLRLEMPNHGTVIHAPGLRIGYVPQHFVAQPSLPISARGLLKLYAPKSAEKIDELASMLDIAQVLDQPVASLSGGELRRLLLARALLHAPQLLVLDEPTQGVDVAGQGELYRLLKRLSESQGFAVLMVSHDLHVVMAATQRVICLNHHICCEGSPSHVGGDPSFVKLFGEDLARQLAMYHHHHDHAHSVHGEQFAHPAEVHEGCSHG
jgi:zinc transport system ATP-binding protein